MIILSIVGNRPQFIKTAVLSEKLRHLGKEILVHTGQHYDDNMSAVFFEELNLPEPDYNLGIGSGNHGEQTGAMLKAIEKVIMKEKPDWTLVYGDTNSTLAGALAAAKLHIKIAHIEAGLRSFNRKMPEEINRVVTDHLSEVLFCPTQTALNNLKAEGITRGVHVVGDVMSETLAFAIERADDRSQILQKLGLEANEYLLATIHRAENTNQINRLENILSALNALSEIVVFPAHPRTRFVIEKINFQLKPHVRLCNPVGYLDMVKLEKSARMILTDSGGIQKEAFWLGVPCVTLREETEWVETVQAGWNRIVGTDSARIVETVNNWWPDNDRPDIFRDSHPSRKIVEILNE